MYLSIYLSVCLSIYLSIYLSILSSPATPRWEPTPEQQVILNLPGTVEMATPNVRAPLGTHHWAPLGTRLWQETANWWELVSGITPTHINICKYHTWDKRQAVIGCMYQTCVLRHHKSESCPRRKEAAALQMCISCWRPTSRLVPC